MTDILVINSSAAQEGSVSRLLVSEALDLLTAADPQASIVHRDLGAMPIPHLTSDNLAGVRGGPEAETEQAARVLSDQLIAEVRAADIILIGAPMYNFSIPTGLRAWFDYVLRPGETFRYSAAGPEGMLAGKRVIVVDRGGFLQARAPGKGRDFQEPYLRQLLSFVGMTDVAFVRAEKLGFGPEAREQAIESARTELGRIIAGGYRAAA